MLNYVVTESDWICSNCSVQFAIEYELHCHFMREIHSQNIINNTKQQD